MSSPIKRAEAQSIDSEKHLPPGQERVSIVVLPVKVNGDQGVSRYTANGGYDGEGLNSKEGVCIDNDNQGEEGREGEDHKSDADESDSNSHHSDIEPMFDSENNRSIGNKASETNLGGTKQGLTHNMNTRDKTTKGLINGKQKQKVSKLTPKPAFTPTKK